MADENRRENSETRKRGVCRVCGCTDEHACEGGCSWADEEHTICTRCVKSEAADV